MYFDNSVFKPSKSRVAKVPLDISAVKVSFLSLDVIEISGAKGVLSFKMPRGVRLYNIDSAIHVAEEDLSFLAIAGTVRSILASMIKGVTVGFTKVLKLSGVGFKASVEGNKIIMSLGYSHPVIFDLPDVISATLISPTSFSLHSCNAVLLGDIVYKIKMLRKLNLYKGRGIYEEGYSFALKEVKKK